MVLLAAVRRVLLGAHGWHAAWLQVMGTWQVRHPGLQPLHKQAVELKRGFAEFTIRHMPRCVRAAHLCRGPQGSRYADRQLHRL